MKDEIAKDREKHNIIFLIADGYTKTIWSRFGSIFKLESRENCVCVCMCKRCMFEHSSYNVLTFTNCTIWTTTVTATAAAATTTHQPISDRNIERDVYYTLAQEKLACKLVSISRRLFFRCALQFTVSYTGDQAAKKIDFNRHRKLFAYVRKVTCSLSSGTYTNHYIVKLQFIALAELRLVLMNAYASATKCAIYALAIDKHCIFGSN